MKLCGHYSGQRPRQNAQSLKPLKITKKTNMHASSGTRRHGDDTSLLITLPDLAKMLKISTRTAARLRSRGKLPKAIQLGGCVRWRRSEIQAWIDAGCP
jgi:predicted DNA-binding transcriptional regulator AlpA